MGGVRGPNVLTIEKVGEVRIGKDAVLLPSVEKGIEIALRTDEKRAELPKEYEVITDCQSWGAGIANRNSQIETRRCFSMIRKVFLTIALAVVVLWVVGCQTVQGIGGDISWIGKKGQDVVER